MRVRSAAPRRPWADLHVGEPEGAPEDVGEVLGRRANSAMAAAYWRGGGCEVAVGPVGEPDERGGRAAAQVVVGVR